MEAGTAEPALIHVSGAWHLQTLARASTVSRAMGLIQQLFRLQSADGSELCPPFPRTLAELSAALDVTARVEGGSVASPACVEVPPTADTGADSRFISQRDDELVFLPPPALCAQVDAPLEASLPPSVLGAPGHVPAGGNGGSAALAQVTPPPPMRASVAAPKVQPATSRAPEHYQPTMPLPCLY